MLDHGKLTFKNYMINTLVDLLNIPVAGQVARSRNRFIVKLSDPMKAAEDKRMALLEQYAEKKDGKIFLDDKTNQYNLGENKEVFEAAFKELSDSTFEIPVVGEFVVDVQRVHTMLNTLDTPMSVATTHNYEEIMQVFEAYAKKD